MIRVLENAFYYLDNFQRVLDWIGERYSDLLTEDEHAFIATFPTLPQPARALFVRMVMRKGELFRATKLHYPEIGCPVAAAQALAPTGWIGADPVLSLDELFSLLTKPELAAVLRLPRQQQAARKLDQRDLLRASAGDARPFSAWCNAGAAADAPDKLDDHAYRILVQPLCDRLRLIFFGNLSQDWTEFVLSDLGVFQYEQVDIAQASRGFRSRRDIDHYMALHSCKQRFAAAEPAADVLQALPTAPFDNDWLESRREKLLFQIGQHFERQQDWTGAHAVYARCRFPGARARAIRVLEKDAQFTRAQALLEQAQQAPESDAERQHLLRMAPRLARKLGLVKPAKPQATAVARLDLCLPMPGAGWWVEGVVRDHLAVDDAPVFYVENALINSLFGLLCWQAIFSAIPGAFFHPFHRGPADLYSADFFQRRTNDFAACFAELDDERYRTTIWRNFAAKRGLASPFVAWECIDEKLLGLALDCIPPSHLKKWCQRILQDVKANRTGFPDLIQFWPAERRYNMIEVKGPGDRLQDNQLRWIDYCATHQMPVAVCYLQWAQQA
jgi:hypothetical protein